MQIPVTLHAIPGNKEEVSWNILGSSAEGICPRLIPGKNAEGGKKKLHPKNCILGDFLLLKKKGYKLNCELSL